MEYFAKTIMPECQCKCLFSPKSGCLFWFFKKGAGEAFLLALSCMPVSVAEYASISLHLPKKPWKWLNKLFYARVLSSMFDRLLKVPPVLNVPGFWIWHGCICKGYKEFCMSLNIPENVWINCCNYAWVLNMPHHFRYLTVFWICCRH